MTSIQVLREVLRDGSTRLVIVNATDTAKRVKLDRDGNVLSVEDVEGCPYG